MDKAAIKTFAINSRRKLMRDVEYRMSLVGVTKDGIQDSISDAEGIQTFTVGGTPYNIYDEDIKKRANLVKEVETKGFENVVEEVAYTWFNRIIAIRFMEVNDYLPTKTRVLSSETPGKIEPDMVTEAFSLDLDYTDKDRQEIFKLKDENKLDELFRFLFIKQCNKLNEILPGLFEKTEDYLELMLNISFTNGDGIVRQLIDTITEEDFTNQVEIIGWLYQYYISEKKDQVININKGNIKKEDIPSATQLFTPDWIVRYMVDNSLGRYWIERNPNNELENYLEYYFGEAEQDDETKIKIDIIRSKGISIENLTFFDPCMGSGHILVYAFDVFLQIYKELGYLEKDIPELILQNNLFGLDIDNRAYQLAYFAVLMRARKYDKRILQKGIIPNVYSINESTTITNDVIDLIEKQDKDIVDDIIYIKKIFRAGKEFGSLIQVRCIDFDILRTSLINIIENSKSTLVDITLVEIIKNDLMALINQAELLSNKYSVVVTNPPYMNKFEKSLKDFAKNNYKDYSQDLYSMFIFRNFDFCEENGYSAFISPFSWMFKQSFEKLRNFIINNKMISSLIQLEYNAFNQIAMVPVCTFVFQNDTNNNLNYKGIYLKLTEFTGGMDVQKEKVLEIINNAEISLNDTMYIKNQSSFKKVPGNPIAYWASENTYNHFSDDRKIKDVVNYSGSLHKTANNEKYLRFFWEIDNENKDFWRHYNKGGRYRKWYGNNYLLVKWTDDAINYYSTHRTANLFKKEFWDLEGITWTALTSGKFNARYFESGFISDFKGASIYPIHDLHYLIGFMNSTVFNYFIGLISPTIDYNIGQVVNVPFIEDNTFDKHLIQENINISKKYWDKQEVSFDFKKNNFIINKFNDNSYMNLIFEELKQDYMSDFKYLKINEEKINKFFIELFDLDNEIDYSVSENDISLYEFDKKVEVISFISYAVGCMFGRYSLDTEGLQFAGGKFDLNKYSKFVPDDDNIIPVLDTEYFEDDIVGRFIEFVKVCFGEETLEENLEFIANALSKSKKTSRQIIRDYFLKNFYKDHLQTFKRCPIYWEFSSGKENGFNCLVYMHRYEPGLVARVRTDYLHKTQKAIELNIANSDNIINNSSVASEISKATKEKNKLIKQLEETREYDEALAYIANQNIEIDLDDGVKVNYAKFQNVEVSKEGQKTKKINLLKKI